MNSAAKTGIPQSGYDCGNTVSYTHLDVYKRQEKICAGLGVEIDYAFQALENVPEGFSVPEGRSKPWGTGQAVLALSLIHI